MLSSALQNHRRPPRVCLYRRSIIEVEHMLGPDTAGELVQGPLPDYGFGVLLRCSLGLERRGLVAFI